MCFPHLYHTHSKVLGMSLLCHRTAIVWVEIKLINQKPVILARSPTVQRWSFKWLAISIFLDKPLRCWIHFSFDLLLGQNDLISLQSFLGHFYFIQAIFLHTHIWGDSSSAEPNIGQPFSGQNKVRTGGDDQNSHLSINPKQPWGYPWCWVDSATNTFQW